MKWLKLLDMMQNRYALGVGNSSPVFSNKGSLSFHPSISPSLPYVSWCVLCPFHCLSCSKVTGDFGKCTCGRSEINEDAL
jgi:hypothetical protein